VRVLDSHNRQHHPIQSSLFLRLLARSSSAFVEGEVFDGGTTTAPAHTPSL